MLTIFTIVLNGSPFIERQLPIFQRLNIPWRWHIVEGVSRPMECTSWCAEVQNKWHRNWLSVDGTSEYLDSVDDPRVRITRRLGPWSGKIAMISAALENVTDGVLLQVDADEFWMPNKIEAVYELMKDREPGDFAQFDCCYFVGPNKFVTTNKGFGSMPYEWFRAWKMAPGLRFNTHEPPALNMLGNCVSRKMTRAMGLVFDHYAYFSEAQVRFKEEFYQYEGLLDGWKRLQKTNGDVRLCDYFKFLKNQPWVIASDI
jgi:hypothetical protein